MIVRLMSGLNSRKRIHHIYSWLILFFLLTSCFNELDKDVRHVDFNENQAVTEEPEVIIDTVPHYYLSENAIRVDLDSFYLYIDSISLFTDSTTLGDDSIFFEVELGSTVQERLFRIFVPDTVKVVVAQRFMTSVSIQNEGPHCDLINWKHHISEWDTLSPLNDSLYYHTNTYGGAEDTLFPDFTMQELIKVVRKTCGREWRDLLKKAENPLEDHVSIGISRVYIRITFLNSEDAIIREKTLIFDIPQGC